MNTLIRFLCNTHSFIYFLIGQLATRSNQGISPKHEIMKYHDFFVENISSEATVLDIGCGNGMVAYDVSQKAKEVIGIDFSSKSIRKAKKTYPRENLRFIIGDATTFKFQKKFDAIILSNVLEHIQKRVDFLKKISGLSSTLLIRVPMINRDWLTLYKTEIGANWRLDKTHYVEYTLDSFKKELRQSGLKIKSHSVQFGEIWAIVEHE